jgi:hypothetical protein
MGEKLFWSNDSAEVISWTLTDLVLFDHMEACDYEIGARSIAMKSKVSIETQTNHENIVIRSNADYVMVNSSLKFVEYGLLIKCRDMYKSANS